MEGIRLRSDSTGSTKNAFYQGTLVSDSHHTKENSGSGRQAQALNSDDPCYRRRRKPKPDRAKHPPLPRRSLDSKDDPYRLLSPDNSVANTEDDLPLFEFSAGNSDPYSFLGGDRPSGFTQQRDSLQYSTNSLFGTNLLNDESDSLLEFDPILIGAENHSGERSDTRRSSVHSTSSGVYFHQSAPPGPLLPTGGSSRPLFPSGSSRPMDSYPTQQANNNMMNGPSYGSIGVPASRRTSIAPVPPTIDENDQSSEESHETDCTIEEEGIISRWLSKDAIYDDEGVPYFDSTSNLTIAGGLRWLFYNPMYPEFTSLQQFCWAVVIGVFMGILTAGWKLLIDWCVEFTWRSVPERLLEWGVFTDLNGRFPLYHYMWITPGILSGVLTYISNSLPTQIPTQNDWIHTLHSNGIQESDTFIPTFLISTIGMASGLSLGPELPLVLTAGMIGSWLGRVCRQSLLQARVMNLTAASAAIGGMFGFPLAGGIFVVELPHRMGLQYFEALSPATIASIVAVLINRIVINNDVTGMFQYPFLSESLPSYIFKDAIVYGLFGGALGIFYTYSVKKIKKFVHHLLDCCGDVSADDHGNENGDSGKPTPYVTSPHSLKKMKGKRNQTEQSSPFAGLIPHTPTRAALTSALSGVMVGITGIFLPHVMFWGEAQLQTIIDKRRTLLPIFGQGDEPTADLVALGYCMMDEGSEKEGLSIGCSIAIVLAKIFVTGLSLGTGIVGGHFWAPLFVGATASQFFTESIGLSSKWLGISTSLTQYPCVALLCIMGATHVVTFRAHMAIILILTLTIDAFVPEDYALRNIKVAGDYSAVFPLLTVAVFVALHISRHITFYEKQRSRGDIQALPEALCEPGKEGKPLVMDYEGKLHALDESDYEYETDSDGDYDDDYSDFFSNNDISNSLSRDDIEANFQERIRLIAPSPTLTDDSKDGSGVAWDASSRNSKKKGSDSEKKKRIRTLDNLLNGPHPPPTKKDAASPQSSVAKRKTHRRTQSEPLLLEDMNQRADAMFESSSRAPSWNRPVLKRVDSYGEIDQGQPSLMDQARRRAASGAKAEHAAKKKKY